MNNSKISRSHNLKLAERGVWVSIAAYIFLSLLQLGVAQITNSASLLANGFNNVTDILGNIAIVIGLRIARIPSDNDHTYGHWKVESIASLISSFIMFFIGFEVLRQTIVGFIEGSSTEINPVGAAVALFSAFVMIAVYLYSSRLAKKTQSKALEASSKDNLSDALTSLGTTVAIVAAALHWIWLDRIMALVICGFILKTAYDIFRDSVFSLSDGFDDNLLADYKEAIELVNKVKSVKMIRGRTYGSNIFLDVVVEMSRDLSVYESHAATEKIERMLMAGFDVYDVDVHVEPAALSEEEHFASRALELLPKEEALLNGKYLDQLLAPQFQAITTKGKIIQQEEYMASAVETEDLAIKNYQAEQVSKKTFILTYHYLDNQKSYTVSSIWRRNEYWRCIYRQVTGES
ncbi:cation diffusion facilitator family transporter [Lactococcus formosensis]|uniref:Cation diffusion facilitator family transporter n=1 Tax=Lactococcus formosensis TaxID=1281486 RepID=A0A9X4P891_9LACT|nr:cation diffusion facilitator family transporter [Lactococcus formosensis]MDG6143285.1 cation diffusion facilitator family transporter [Lactococcus formosensis]MDG6155666.1 cation diffusion facilitator family transporter [Lactococcus formosensis]MDG6160583.1 cation diffusion facilitator family transporter [Lactococcus formosensis]MDG6166831.1 cation diffusion facilitator family transporter [Lactococcus formosensis]MDG6173209.1 cation diffusion facilitator family transporter [Lactococcus form